MMLAYLFYFTKPPLMMMTAARRRLSKNGDKIPRTNRRRLLDR